MIIEQAKFTDSPLSKAFKKQIKVIEDQGIKQVEALKAIKSEENWELETIERIFPKNRRNNVIKTELNEMKEWKEKNKRKYLIYNTKKCKYDFQQYETIRLFGENIYTGKISIDVAEMDQSDLLINQFKQFIDKYRPRAT